MSRRLDLLMLYDKSYGRGILIESHQPWKVPSRHLSSVLSNNCFGCGHTSRSGWAGLETCLTKHLIRLTKSAASESGTVTAEPA